MTYVSGRIASLACRALVLGLLAVPALAYPSLVGTWTTKSDDGKGTMIFHFLQNGRFVQQWARSNASAVTITYVGDYGFDGSRLVFTVDTWFNAMNGGQRDDLPRPPKGYVGSANTETIQFQNDDELIFQGQVWTRVLQ